MPSEAIPKVDAIASSRWGQIMGWTPAKAVTAWGIVQGAISDGDSSPAVSKFRSGTTAANMHRHFRTFKLCPDRLIDLCCRREL